MKKRFIGLYLLCCALLVGCAAGVCADVPTISESVPAAESHAVDSNPEKAPGSLSAGGKQEDLLPEKKPVIVQKDDAAKQEENLTEEEKAQLRFERGEKFALGEDVGSFVGSAAYVHTADGAPLRRYDGHKEMQEDGLELWTFSSYDSAVEADKKGFVLVMNESVPQDAFYYADIDFYMMDWERMNEDGPPAGLLRSYQKWDAATQTYTRFFDRSDFELTVDLAARKVSGEYKIQPGNVCDVLAHSPCGRYDICETGRYAAGDGGISSIALRDNETGSFQWLSLRRSWFSDYGFFANGDLYVREPDCLRMFYKESGYTKQAPFELPLGAQPEGFTRYLSAVRRDPVDGTYLVVYYEQTEQQAADRWMNPFETDVCFVIGKCDQNGRLLKSWNSGQIVVSPLYDTTWVDLWLQDGDIYVNAFQKSYQTPVVSFVFDPETEAFSVLRDPRTAENRYAEDEELFAAGPVYPVCGTVQAVWASGYGVLIRANETAEIKNWDEMKLARSGGSMAAMVQPYTEDEKVPGVGCAALLTGADGSVATAYSEQALFPVHDLALEEKDPNAVDSVWLNAAAKKLFYLCEHADVLITADFSTGTVTARPYVR